MYDSEHGWHLLVARADLADARLVPAPVPEPGPGQAVLRVERVGVTANNVTYAVLGESLRYWEFFPVPGAATGHDGRVPLWGYATVVASRADGVAEGERVYGYLPSSSHLLVTPGRVGPTGFRDISGHRATLPSPYQAYQRSDPATPAGEEELQTLYRPLFTTSWMLADALADVAAERVVLSSASSKTAYGTAHLLRGPGRRVVGLTSTRSRGFVEGLGLYDEVLGYGEVAALGTPAVPTVYVDLSGDPALRAAVRSAVAGALVEDLVVGFTHHGAADASLRSTGAGNPEDAPPRVFFAPDRIAQRYRAWGREGLRGAPRGRLVRLRRRAREPGAGGPLGRPRDAAHGVAGGARRHRRPRHRCGHHVLATTSARHPLFNSHDGPSGPTL